MEVVEVGEMQREKRGVPRTLVLQGISVEEDELWTRRRPRGSVRFPSRRGNRPCLGWGWIRLLVTLEPLRRRTVVVLPNLRGSRRSTRWEEEVEEVVVAVVVKVVMAERVIEVSGRRIEEWEKVRPFSVSSSSSSSPRRRIRELSEELEERAPEGKTTTVDPTWSSSSRRWSCSVPGATRDSEDSRWQSSDEAVVKEEEVWRGMQG